MTINPGGEPVMLKSYDEMTADQKLAYKMGREAERARWDDPAEIRAAVVPHLDLEPAAELVRELIDRIPPVLDFPRDATTWTLAIICAALGLGEDTEGGEK